MLEASTLVAQSSGLADTVAEVVELGSSGIATPDHLDLGKSWSALHQLTMTADGRHLIAMLPVGGNQDYQNMAFVTVDLVAKKVVKRVVNTNPKDYSFLQAIPC